MIIGTVHTWYEHLSRVKKKKTSFGKCHANISKIVQLSKISLLFFA